MMPLPLLPLLPPLPLPLLPLPVRSMPQPPLRPLPDDEDGGTTVGATVAVASGDAVGNGSTGGAGGVVVVG